MMGRTLILWALFALAAPSQDASGPKKLLRAGRSAEAAIEVQRAIPRLVSAAAREKYLRELSPAFLEAGAGRVLLDALPESQDPVLDWYRGVLNLDLRRLGEAEAAFGSCAEKMRARGGDPANSGLRSQLFKLAQLRFDDAKAAELASELGEGWAEAEAWHRRRLSERGAAESRQLLSLLVALIVIAGVALLGRKRA